MSKRTKYTAEEKLKILMEYQNNYISIVELCGIYEIYYTTFYKWKKQYEKQGIEGLRESRTWKKYSKRLKEAAVLDYLSGNYSLRDIIDKYEISSVSVLERWVNRYSHRELKGTRKGMSNL
ncbi:helix-turn-helix domain-containing protein [Tissierella sp. MSJ-40]|uniref:Helix-turn-helix domain-containing protein n=1 Tax=Tissierella simiarum TaxID=2841534 RepID=A0ABS6E4K0_9FIRM|nr:helix-turn-helix domain-containing protein [Tissierella simiarum]MBU5437496.1 helix-turn-helix domain-containing protein [Tissierella simiarum]